MIVELLIGCCVVLTLHLLIQRISYTKKLDHLMNVISDRDADIVILEQRLDGFNQKLKRAHLDLKYRSMEHKALGDQIAAVKEALGDA